jgi:lipid-binding SYLF domain-containing protein
MRTSLLVISLLFSLLSFYGCAKPQGYSPQSKRAYILQMRDNTLAEIYSKSPYMKDLVAHAAGYGVFSNINTQLLIIGSGNGYGVVTDNANGKTTFMRMAEGGVGLGVALTDFKELIIFNNPAVMRQFISSGWDFGVQGDAVLKSKTQGAAASGSVPFDSDIVIYQLTKQGIALRTNVGAEKYWIDSDLNYY